MKGNAKDSDHDTVSYSWRQTGGDSVILKDDDTPKVTFNAPEVDGNKVLTFSLTVADIKGGQDTDSINIRIKDIPDAINKQFFDNQFPQNRIVRSAIINATH